MAQTSAAYPPTQAALSATSTAIALAVVSAERLAFLVQVAAPLQALLPAPAVPPRMRVLNPDELLPAHRLPDAGTLQILDSQWKEDAHGD